MQNFLVILHYLKKFSQESYFAKNTVDSPNFLIWKFCGKAQFPHSFGRIAQHYAETVPFHKIPIPGNYAKLRYSEQFYVIPAELYS